MLKRFLFCSLCIIFLIIPLKQDTNANTWERHDTTVLSDSIIAAINRGDSILIDGCKIFGSLTKIGNMQKPDTIENLIRIVNTTFNDTVRYLGCYFSNDIYFDSCIYFQMVDFSFVIFKAITNFHGADFHKFASFSNSIFEDSVDFDQTTFNDGVAIHNSIFRGEASFGMAHIKIGALFFETEFDKRVSFNYATCDWISFVKVHFNGEASFIDSYFEEANFRMAIFSDIVYFSLKNYNKVYITWEQLKIHLWHSKPDVYKLMRYFEEQRQLDDADGVYFFLKNQERIKKPWYIRYPEYWFFQLTCGYGVKPLNTLYSSAGIIILFAIFYTLRFNSIKEIEKRFLHSRKPRILRKVRKSLRKRFYDALYFSVHTFIIGVVSDWYPTDNYLIKLGKRRICKFRTLSMIEGVLGWVLLVLFVVTLTRKFIR